MKRNRITQIGAWCAAAIATAAFSATAAQAQSSTSGGGGGPAGNAAMNSSPGINTSNGTGARGGVPSPATHRVMVNGRPVDGDVAPQMINGSIMVPVRFITEYLGGQVHWDGSDRSVSMHKGTQRIRMTIGSKQAYVNSEGRALSANPVIVDGRTLVPLREASRLLGAVIDYNDKTQVVFVSTPNGSVEPPLRTNYGARMARP